MGYDSALEQVMIQGFRVLFMLSLPVLIVASLSGILVGALQAATSIRDPASAYAVRLLALIVVFYAFSSTIAQQLTNLAEMAFR